MLSLYSHSIEVLTPSWCICHSSEGDELRTLAQICNDVPHFQTRRVF